MNVSLKPRSTRQVLDAHLENRASGNLEKDLAENYSNDVVLLCDHGAKRGHKGVTESAGRLQQQLAGGAFTIEYLFVDGEFAFLRWHGESATTFLENGADTFAIRDGRIIMQSIFYTIREK